MDYVFDIDGTLADATHRLHFIKDMTYWKSVNGSVPKPDWDSFLSDEQVVEDTPIKAIWEILYSLLLSPGNRVIFITSRKESQRYTTYHWLYDSKMECPVRMFCGNHWNERRRSGGINGPLLYMRSNGDRRPSSIVKGELLDKARLDGFEPKMVFEDRKDDTAMWREKGLICAQVADGDY